MSWVVALCNQVSVSQQQQQKKLLLLLLCQLFTTILYHLPEPFSALSPVLGSTTATVEGDPSDFSTTPTLVPLTTDSDCVLIIRTGTQGEDGFISALSILTGRHPVWSPSSSHTPSRNGLSLSPPFY